MSDFDLSNFVAKLGVFAGGTAWAISLAIRKWAETRTDMAGAGAKVDIIDMLATRVRSLEDTVERVRKEFDSERKLRMDAEGRVFALMQQVAVLEAKLRSLGHDPAFKE